MWWVLSGQVCALWGRVSSGNSLKRSNCCLRAVFPGCGRWSLPGMGWGRDSLPVGPVEEGVG